MKSEYLNVFFFHLYFHKQIKGQAQIIILEKRIPFATCKFARQIANGFTLHFIVVLLSLMVRVLA